MKRLQLAIGLMLLGTFGCRDAASPGGSLALEVIGDVAVDEGVSEDAIAVSSDGMRVARTRVEIAFAADATPSDVEDVLASIEGSVVSSVRGLLRVVVSIPDAGTIEGAEAVARRAADHPRVRSASLAAIADPTELPSHYPTPLPELWRDTLANQLAVRAPAAWNARAALPDPSSAPLVVFADYFGEGVPDASFAVRVAPEDFANLGGPWPAHGYGTLGVFAATWQDASINERSSVTGIYPGEIDLRVVNITGQFGTVLTVPEKEDRIIRLIRDAGRPVVLNTSTGLGCETCSPDRVREFALAWIERVRGSAGFLGIGVSPNLEERFFHATAAGNVLTGDVDARFASQYSAAALHPDLGVTPLSNVAVVENIAVAEEIPIAPGCLSPGSKRPGNIAAVGTRVYTFTAARRPATGIAVTTDYLPGTSLATPQVSGAGAYLWALDPGARPGEILQRLLQTASPPREACSLAKSAPVLDAYAAILSADSAGRMPARGTILDVVKNDRFDEADLEAYLRELSSRAGALDYYRYDLNGDGYTGGAVRVAFDLDGDLSFSEQVDKAIEDEEVAFDERALSDLSVLCWYAYSELYVGDGSVRDGMLGKAACGRGYQLDISTYAGYCAGDEHEVTVWATRRTTSGRIPQGGLWIEVSIVGGVPDRISGNADDNGRFEQRIQYVAEQLIVRAEAFERQGGLRVAYAETTATGRDCTPPPLPCTAIPGSTYQARLTTTEFGTSVVYEETGVNECLEPGIECRWLAHVVETRTPMNGMTTTQQYSRAGPATAALRNLAHCTRSGEFHLLGAGGTDDDGSTHTFSGCNLQEGITADWTCCEGPDGTFSICRGS